MVENTINEFKLRVTTESVTRALQYFNNDMNHFVSHLHSIFQSTLKEKQRCNTVTMEIVCTALKEYNEKQFFEGIFNNNDSGSTSKLRPLSLSPSLMFLGHTSNERVNMTQEPPPEAIKPVAERPVSQTFQSVQIEEAPHQEVFPPVSLSQESPQSMEFSDNSENPSPSLSLPIEKRQKTTRKSPKPVSRQRLREAIAVMNHQKIHPKTVLKLVSYKTFKSNVTHEQDRRMKTFYEWVHRNNYYSVFEQYHSIFDFWNGLLSPWYVDDSNDELKHMILYSMMTDNCKRQLINEFRL